jgi:hypothetical protein
VKEPDRRLWTAIDHLSEWQTANEGHTSKRCLEAIRHAFTETGLRLPQSNIDYQGMLAITCGKTLALTPKRWGWKLLGKNKSALPTNQPSLVFFNRCGKLASGKTAGHIAVFKPSTDRHISNESHNMDSWWLDRVCFVFQPLPEKT